ncbi:MAG: DUF1156 domain-containing protein, partial [Microcystis sp. M165S2]|nr:DUF1156 domain-containing protein [Microcystis sp. M165S2]
MPLVRSFALSTKKGKEAWIDYEVIGNRYEVIGNREERTVASPLPSSLSSLPSSPSIRFSVKSGTGKPPEGTVSRKGARCIACESDVKLDHVRAEGKAGRMGAQLMAIVAEGNKGRIYLSPSEEQEEVILKAKPEWMPEATLPHNPRDFKTPNYGMRTFAELFTNRQLVAMTTFSDLASEAREKVIADGGTEEYANAVVTYLAFLVDQLANHQSSICSWHSRNEQMRNVFARQAIPMVWDFAESNVFCESSGSFQNLFDRMIKGLESVPTTSRGKVIQHNATEPHKDASSLKLISTDPPYYDNIGYADLSDFFYVWLRKVLIEVYPSLFSTLLVPKTPELIAAPHRFGGNKEKAKEFFEQGLKEVFSQIYKAANPDYPVTVYYAFKQTENDNDELEEDKSSSSVASTGWETMLEGLIQSGFSITGTVPMRTEMVNRSIASGTN